MPSRRITSQDLNPSICLQNQLCTWFWCSVATWSNWAVNPTASLFTNRRCLPLSRVSAVSCVFLHHQGNAVDMIESLDPSTLVLITWDPLSSLNRLEFVKPISIVLEPYVHTNYAVSSSQIRVFRNSSKLLTPYRWRVDFWEAIIA